MKFRLNFWSRELMPWPKGVRTEPSIVASSKFTSVFDLYFTDLLSSRPFRPPELFLGAESAAIGKMSNDKTAKRLNFLLICILAPLVWHLIGILADSLEGV